MCGADQAIRGADRFQIRERRMVGRQQQMIAIVDHHVELRVVIGAAAPARLSRRLVHSDVLAARGEADGGGKAG
jgi:hypothetical protein